MEILKEVGQKDTEIRNSEKETIQTVGEKDSEKRQFNWEIIKTAGTVLMVTVAVGVGVLGGKVELKLPKRT